MNHYTKELYHYGILGMKWGVRRYQRRDGTLTEAGKKRYGVEGRSYNEYKADREYVKKHGMNVDYEYDLKTKQIYLTGNYYDKRTGKKLSPTYAQALLTGKYKSDQPLKEFGDSKRNKVVSKKEITKGKAIVNGVLRQIGFSVASGVASQAIAKAGYETAAAYGGLTVFTFGTLANVGKTIYDVSKAK